MWKLILVLSLVFRGVSVSLAADAPVKLGTVDMQKALQAVDEGRKAKSQLEKEFNERKKSIQAEEASIRKAGEEFKKQSAVLTDEAKAKKNSELQERMMKLQELTMRSQQDIQKKERELTDPLIKRLRIVIEKIAKEKGYTVVLEKNENTVLYSPEKDDLTTEVVSAFNKQKS